MCQGCEDFAEFDRLMDAYIAEILPAMLSRPLDADVIYGRTGSGVHRTADGQEKAL